MPTQRFRQALNSLGRVVYPEVCLGCGRPLATSVVCASCRRLLVRPEPRDVAERIARASPNPFAVSIALWRFDAGGTVQRIQHALKYRGRPSLGVAFGRDLGNAASRLSWRPDLVIPVPLSRARALERGYNQAEPLARGLAESLDLPLATTLVSRSRATRSQATVAFGDRRANVDGAFCVSPAASEVPLRGARILLVDDVLTTGATLLAAAAPLRARGAEVGVAVLALAG